MLAQTRIKLKNAESSISFMQQQHAKTLEGLHQEIQKLQQKNARLTFELAMKSTPGSRSGPGHGTCTCKLLEEEIKSTKADNLGLRSSLSSREETINLLEHKIKELRCKLDEEISTKGADISRAKEELESKSNAIAYLTQQLHHSKMRLKRALENNAHSQGCTGNTSTHIGAVSSSRTTTPRICRVVRRATSSPAPQDVSSLSNLELGSSKCSSPFTPKPPSTAIPPHITPPRRASNPGRRRTLEKDPECVLTERVSEHSLDPIQGYRHATPPPDICEILQSQERKVQIVTKPSPPILPPIRSDTSIPTQKTCDDSVTHDTVVPSHSVEYTSSCHPQYPHRHRHFILAKSQGLSSAPSTLRVLRYQTQGIGEGRAVKEEEEEEVDEEEAEGTLLVKESMNRKDQAWQQLHQQHWAD